jgi:hypothetical protein
MKHTLKKQILVVALSGAMLGTGVLAQDTQTPTQQEAQGQDNAGGHHSDLGEHNGQQGFGSGEYGGHQGYGHDGNRPGMGGIPLGRHLALDTKMTFSFYNADPASGATPLSTLEFTYGVDSEAAFAETFQAAKAASTFMKVDVGEQTRTVDLSVFDTTQRQGLVPRELSRPGTLNDGSTITATFYDGDPENGGTVLETLSFTQGTSSEAGFADDFSTATESAAYVKITTSPQTQTIDLSAMPQRGQDFGSRGFGHGLNDKGNNH